VICDVIISTENNRFIARAKNWPEIAVQENSRDEAIERITARLSEYLNHKMELIKIDVPIVSQTGNPWLDKFGWFKDDPTFDDFEAEIAAYRHEIDKKMGPAVQ